MAAAWRSARAGPRADWRADHQWEAMVPGTLTISLDFELFWGVHDKRELRTYGDHILGARAAIPRMLDLFERYGVHCTWATVGLLFFDDKEELLQYLPQERPRYVNPALSPYPRIAGIGAGERVDPYHYGLSLVRLIKDCPDQEIGTHTFSHYYCLEEGQTLETFRADLEAAHRAAERLGIALRSLVFPRNQFSQAYLRTCRDAGIETVRGNQSFWLFRSDGEANEGLVKKCGRRLDHFLPLSGHNGITPECDRLGVVNIRSSRFLLPAGARFEILSPLCQRRIMRSMTHAAVSGDIYHLWWHPHNFGARLDDNMRMLQEIVEHYRALSETHGMVSRNMGELAAAMREDARETSLDGAALESSPDVLSAARVRA